ncbi:ABC transporter permease [Marinitoga litoralis]|uniref:ABC transporter permease n=1 Tax=Marinitoga litoralis TaxID=570855 RepID=UPI0013EBBDE0
MIKYDSIVICINISKLIYLHLGFLKFIIVFIFLLIQTMTLSGISASVSAIIGKSVTAVAVVNSIIIPLLQYLSPIYFPINVFPSILQPIVKVNPITHAIEFVREYVLRGIFNAKMLSISALNAIFWFVIGYILLKMTIINIWKYKN